MSVVSLGSESAVRLLVFGGTSLLAQVVTLEHLLADVVCEPGDLRPTHAEFLNRGMTVDDT